MFQYTIEHYEPDRVSALRLKELLLKLDHCFVPSISSRTPLDAYSQKIRCFADVFIACEQLEDLGLCAIYTNMFPSAFVTTIGVCPHVSRHGLGRKLLYESLEFARSKGMEKVGLEVSPNNIAALAFYQKMGFDSIFKYNDLIRMEISLLA